MPVRDFRGWSPVSCLQKIEISVKFIYEMNHGCIISVCKLDSDVEKGLYPSQWPRLNFAQRIS